MFSIGCKAKVHQHLNPLHCLIFEYTGENNKPIPILIFCDSSFKISNPDYHEAFIVEDKILDSMGCCIPKKSQIINQPKYPLYKITMANERSQDILYITSAETLNQLIDCLESHLSKNDFYYAFVYFEDARAMNPRE